MQQRPRNFGLARSVYTLRTTKYSLTY